MQIVSQLQFARKVKSYFLAKNKKKIKCRLLNFSSSMLCVKGLIIEIFRIIYNLSGLHKDYDEKCPRALFYINYIVQWNRH